jgi:hypothetical protein
MVAMKANTARKRKSDGIDQTVDLSHAAGRRVRIRELCDLHQMHLGDFGGGMV